MRRSDQQGFTLIEALVALAIVATVVISFLGIRTKALVDTMHARNWRLAREIAEQQMSILQAGAHDTQPQSEVEISLEDKYSEGWSYKIVLGESAVADAESAIDEAAAGGDDVAFERSEFHKNREQFRKANAEGLSYQEYQDKLYEEDTQRRLEETAPSEIDFEEVAVVVYFPKLDGERETDRDALMIKARVSTLAISGLTPEQAQSIAESRGQATSSSSSGESNPFGTAPSGQ